MQEENTESSVPPNMVISAWIIERLLEHIFLDSAPACEVLMHQSLKQRMGLVLLLRIYIN